MGGKDGRWVADQRQDGRRFVVTGGSGGLGLETARVLAANGAEVVLAVRNEAKGEAAAATLTGKVEVRRLDVADLASVREFAAEIGPVDVLINNAGVLAVPYALTVDGFEIQLATNHLGHFALANLMLPQISDRVVAISSDSHRLAKLDLTDLNWERRPYKGFTAYTTSKLANLLFMAELQRRLTAAGSTVRSVAAHPGSTATSITGNTGNALKTWVGSWGHKVAGMSVEKGALSSLYAATMDIPGNSFIGPDGFKEMSGWPTGVARSRAAVDPDLARGLWERSEEMTGVRFPL
ncbi:oxidoreductase [Nocardioides sp. Root1257]|uniref:oxidoreductase n=1 Tax=unclassified Nocardioides TaxID=2615069 RepID=UPI00070173BA|nr:MULTISPECIES: oxidoreductase [unclassified Nocardioides]KQW52957.1 oxidoreductase [Nocardioides sp. Root1257]KRC55645.1 oxidoreductase [Nocardioides sp. Root224]